MLPSLRALSVLVVPLLIAACDPRLVSSSNLSPREVATLSGVWEGRGLFSFGDQDCPKVYLWTMKLDRGNVDGSVVDERTPNAPPTRFTSFVDYDGSMRISIRPDERDTTVSGSFGHNSFIGQARAKKCTYSLRLFRREGAS